MGVGSLSSLSLLYQTAFLFFASFVQKLTYIYNSTMVVKNMCVLFLNVSYMNNVKGDLGIKSARLMNVVQIYFS